MENREKEGWVKYAGEDENSHPSSPQPQLARGHSLQQQVQNWHGGNLGAISWMNSVEIGVRWMVQISGTHQKSGRSREQRGWKGLCPIGISPEKTGTEMVWEREQNFRGKR